MALDLGYFLDMATFEQILNLDNDDDEREFSKSIVFDFFIQAQTTFQEMDSNLEARDLAGVFMLGHFLKGSAATLGLVKVMDSCDKIQQLGMHRDGTSSKEETDNEKGLEQCREIINQAKSEFYEAEAALRRYYHDERR